ncbi:MAG: TraR/DksA C4-type zinc finger protein [Anaeromicrobium sp.]|jgi:YteA family regulatory protein|uniref:TraR/DksA C4-type zinc finger protein n=1 Tax=Anaeromicrobium sp. TaxID=1929132 RepID=UPI0025D61BAB|nr:TraR/DksA C4-type zinc finger protein [Anaeromicrobium sp.]MCT4594913.1 TraR/DksA C4-type zinc finger protein [Anaeromicrobium sp.]
MDRDKLSYFKKKLIKERENAINTVELSNKNENNEGLKDYNYELSSYDNHPADMGTETFQMEMNMCLKDDEKLYIRDINNALERIEKGTYGTCFMCNKPIEKERLEFMPTAINCINCEKEEGLELNEILQTRPVEEDVLGVPFGESSLEKANINGFDGEDALQEVNRNNRTKHESLDWYDNNYDRTISGVVEEVDKISESYYEEQK